MDPIKYFKINKKDTNDFHEIFSKHNNLDFGSFCMNIRLIKLLSKKNISTIIKFINMFIDVNKFESRPIYAMHKFTLSGYMLYMIPFMNNKMDIYTIVEHLLKRNMDTNKLCFEFDDLHGINWLETNTVIGRDRFVVVMDVINNYPIIQNTRKIINNNDVQLFDINNDIQFIELLLLICKCKQKNLPKFIITHKILYYYLLYKNKNKHNYET